jgi:GNAT superfamily N-acetyltransferase
MDNVTLSGYAPGVIGRITELHATYYHEHWGFDVSFETQVARESAEFISRFQKNTDGLWVASTAGRFAGAVAVDGRKARQEGARLRWFIVAPEYQERGIGTLLLKEAVAFCRRAGHRRLYLWTFEGLDAARALYEREGFQLCKERDVRQWGRQLKEQRFEMLL